MFRVLLMEQGEPIKVMEDGISTYEEAEYCVAELIIQTGDSDFLIERSSSNVNLRES